MHNPKDGKVVTFSDLAALLRQKIWLLVAAALVTSSGTWLAGRFLIRPQYASTATLYILRQDTEQTDADFSLALKVIGDCAYLVKSHAVVDQVIQNLDLDTDYDTLCAGIFTANPENTRILEVTVKARTPQLAKRIADELCRVSQEKIDSVMGFRQVNLFEPGTLDQDPCNTIPPVVYPGAAIVAVGLCYGLCLVIFLLDDRLRSEEDIRLVLEVGILGDIPLADGKPADHPKED